MEDDTVGLHLRSAGSSGDRFNLFFQPSDVILLLNYLLTLREEKRNASHRDGDLLACQCTSTDPS